MSNNHLVPTMQRVVFALLVVLSLSACVDLTSPGVKGGQGSGVSDARAAGGAPDSALLGSGGAGGADAGKDSSSASAGQAGASAEGGGSDSSVGGGGAGGSVGGGGGDSAADVGGAGGGSADAQRADGIKDSPVESSGGDSGDGGVRRDSSVADTWLAPSDTLAESGGGDLPFDSREASFEVSSGIEAASDGPSPSDVGPDSGEPPDLAPDLSPDLVSDLPVDQSTCKPRIYDAKTANHSAGQSESDGWYLSASGQFLYWQNIDYPAGRTTVTVVARGDFDSGAWPKMDVSAEGQDHIIGADAEVSSDKMTAYNFTFDAQAKTSTGVGITAKSSKGVHVQSVTIGCPTH